MVLTSASMHSRWLTGRAIGLHFLAVIVVAGCLIAGWWQLHQALKGNTLSWAYTVEWPVFAIIAVVAWWHLIHEEPAERAARAEKAAQAGRAAAQRRVEASRTDAGPRSWRDATFDAYEWDEVTEVDANRMAAAAQEEYRAHLDRIAARDGAESRRWRKAKERS